MEDWLNKAVAEHFIQNAEQLALQVCMKVFKAHFYKASFLLMCL